MTNILKRFITETFIREKNRCSLSIFFALSCQTHTKKGQTQQIFVK